MRNISNKKKANELLQIQKKEIEMQKKNVETTLNELRSTQSQLIQSEKMASLGELTAGIAHEIQNPLNFVNNFAEVNAELIEDAIAALKEGDTAETRSLLNDLKDNEQKINHHGKRADAIVKGMLQHSHNNNGIKEPTDINALADEYLRLAYHGLRAKDKTFSASIKTDYTDSLGKATVNSQDLGRVLLNLFNNAFYAVSQKKKSGDESFEPLIRVITKRSGDRISIIVSDNGIGIPLRILDKIFQPFFTTKPTGQGTGLGLSLSYDIIRSQGGEITVNSKENEGSEFIVTLPE
jgi:two-component system NtrC family sensor kinase